MPDTETRRRILEIAREAFLSKGYGATSVEEIATEAGVSKKTIYRYAFSKADLFRIVVSEVSSLLSDTANVEEHQEDPAVALRAFLEPIASEALSNDGLRFFRLMVRDASSIPEMAMAYRDATMSLSKNIVRWMEHRKDSGWLGDFSASTAARVVMTMLLAETRIGFLMGVRQAPDSAERSLILDQAVSLFLRALGPTQE